MDRYSLFVFTPKHASWLNLIEGFFSKMTKQMLRGIRVKSKDELISRISNILMRSTKHLWNTIGHGTWMISIHQKQL